MNKSQSFQVIQPSTILLTGVTGAVGSWLANEAHLNGHHVLTLMRDSNLKDAQLRLQATMEAIGKPHVAEHVDIVKGDITSPLFGCDPYSETMKQVQLLLHCAASVKFHERAAEQIQKANIDGTRNAMHLAETLQIPLVYISTAYIAGKRTGVVYEYENDVGQSFKNEYEKTKCATEVMLQQWSKTTGLPLYIFRPSIVLGGSTNGSTPQFNAFYSILQLCNIAQHQLQNSILRILGNPETTFNFVPADTVAQIVFYILQNSTPNTYHITNPQPTRFQTLQIMLEQLFQIQKIRVLPSEQFDHCNHSNVDKFFDKMLQIYRPYLINIEPQFDQTNTMEALQYSGITYPEINLKYFQRMLDYARSVNWLRASLQGKKQMEDAVVVD